MGGPGSGRRWHRGGKSTTVAYRAIDVRRWHRDGLLKPAQRFDCIWTEADRHVAEIHVLVALDRVVLVYDSCTDRCDWRRHERDVYLAWTPCTYGGARPWFRCPGCGRRAALLYGGPTFKCRRCRDLAYPSQSDGPTGRALRRAEKIRERLGWRPGVAHGIGSKPKGMHWRTFERIVSKYQRYAWCGATGMIARLRM
jgi:hypothetical protein